MHATGVVHRDIKPKNVVVDGQGVAKIIDRGIAADLVAPSKLTSPGVLSRDGRRVALVLNRLV